MDRCQFARELDLGEAGHGSIVREDHVSPRYLLDPGEKLCLRPARGAAAGL
jgi:hypothetical protein